MENQKDALHHAEAFGASGKLGSLRSRAREHVPQGGAIAIAAGGSSWNIEKKRDWAPPSVKSIRSNWWWALWTLRSWSIDIVRNPRLEAFALNLADPAKISTKVNLLCSVDETDCDTVAASCEISPSLGSTKAVSLWILLFTTSLYCMRLGVSGFDSNARFRETTSSQSWVHSTNGLCLKHLSLKHTCMREIYPH